MSSEKIGAGAVSDGALRALDAMHLKPFVMMYVPILDGVLFADPFIKMANVYVDADFHQFIFQEAEQIKDDEYFTPHGDGEYLYILWLNWCEAYETPYWDTECVELLWWEPWGTNDSAEVETVVEIVDVDDIPF